VSSFTIRLAILGTILAFAFAAAQSINFACSFQVCFPAVFFAAVAAFGLFKKSVLRSQSARWVGASIAMALVAAGSMANGLLVLPLLAVMAVWLRLPRRVAAILAVLGAVVIVAYTRGDQMRNASALSDSLLRTPELAVFTFAYLGSALDEPVMAVTKAIGLDWERYRILLSALAGAFGIGWLIRRLALAVSEPRQASAEHIALLHILLFLVASAAMTAYGRVQFPMIDVLTSRYVTASLLFWACLFGLVLSASAAESSPDQLAFNRRLRLAVLGATIFIGVTVQLPKVKYAGDAERYLAEGEYALINNVFAAEAWQRFWTPGAMIPIVRHFRTHHLASFSREWTHWIGDPAAAHFVMSSSDSDCLGGWESVSHVGGTFNPAALAAGWGYDRRFKRAPERLVFTDATRRIVGFATSTRRRPDLLPGYPEFSTDRVGWISYLPAGLSSDMTAYLVLGDGRRLCRVGAAHVPGNYLTTPAAKAGEIIAGAEVSVQGTWVSNVRPPDAAIPPFATDTWSSHTLSSRTGVLRLGPVKVTGGASIGLPVITGPGASAVQISAIERGTGEVLAATNPPAGTSTWDLWTLDMPQGAPATIVDYVIEQGHNGAGEWVVVGLPRQIQP
jgi:hypothetical protein